jgi:hypothetical protein
MGKPPESSALRSVGIASDCIGAASRKPALTHARSENLFTFESGHYLEPRARPRRTRMSRESSPLGTKGQCRVLLKFTGILANTCCSLTQSRCSVSLQLGWRGILGGPEGCSRELHFLIHFKGKTIHTRLLELSNLDERHYRLL